jgi:hypothetical protein
MEFLHVFSKIHQETMANMANQIQQLAITHKTSEKT